MVTVAGFADATYIWVDLKKWKLCYVSAFVVAHSYVLEKEMATHSSVLSWRIPWTEEPGRLQSMGSLRVGHDWATSLSLFTFMHWRGKWQPTPVFLPGESHRQRSLVGCHLWSRTESDMNWSDLAAAFICIPNLYLNNLPETLER